METGDLTRQQTIRNITALHPEKGADAAIALWEQMATELVALIGEGGFDSLYARSVFLTQPTFPWIAAAAQSAQAGHRYAALKASLAAQPPAQAIEANRLLLTTFTDILASLIGEQLTTRMLHSAWGSDAAHIVGNKKQQPGHPDRASEGVPR